MKRQLGRNKEGEEASGDAGRKQDKHKLTLSLQRDGAAHMLPEERMKKLLEAVVEAAAKNQKEQEQQLTIDKLQNIRIDGSRISFQCAAEQASLFSPCYRFGKTFTVEVFDAEHLLATATPYAAYEQQQQSQQQQQ